MCLYTVVTRNYRSTRSLSTARSLSPARQAERRTTTASAAATIPAMEQRLSWLVGQIRTLTAEEGSLVSEYRHLCAQTSAVTQDYGLTTDAGRLKENVKKNRYKDILPYDQTRVPLTLLTQEHDSDYINASFIQGATETRTYIATQGPLKQTLVDLWRMMWEYDVKVILMACREFEMGKRKCECYWSTLSETSSFGLFIVSNLEECSPTEEVIVRALAVRYQNETRTICQFQYTAWPDHDIPSAAHGILGMMDLARQAQGSSTSPVLVHCSAGCGRTGVICALDYVHDLLVTKQISKDFSIMKIVLELRRQRPSSVQTKEQYQFVFSAVAHMFEKALLSPVTSDPHPKKSLSSYDDVQSLKVQRSLDRSASGTPSLPPSAPDPRQPKMDDTYAVVNKTKQLLPPPSAPSTPSTPPAALHHYDNEELGTLKCPAASLYSTVKPRKRCPGNPPTPIYDTAGPANHRLAEASAEAEQSGYEFVTPADDHSSTEDDYEYVSNPIKATGSSPGGMGFNCRIRKPQGPRDPPAEWTRLER